MGSDWRVVRPRTEYHAESEFCLAIFTSSDNFVLFLPVRVLCGFFETDSSGEWFRFSHAMFNYHYYVQIADRTLEIQHLLGYLSHFERRSIIMLWISREYVQEASLVIDDTSTKYVILPNRFSQRTFYKANNKPNAKNNRGATHRDYQIK